MKKYFALPNRGSIDHRGRKNKRKHSSFETVSEKNIAQHDSLESLTENIPSLNSPNFKPIDSKLKKSPTFQKNLSELEDSLCNDLKHVKLEDPDGFYF